MIDFDPKELEVQAKTVPAFKPLPQSMVGTDFNQNTEPKHVSISDNKSEKSRPEVESRK